MAVMHSGAFKRDAVRIAQSSKDQKTIRGLFFRRMEGSNTEGGDVLRSLKSMKFQYIIDSRGSIARSHLCCMICVTDQGA